MWQALVVAEAEYGAAWAWNPGRWGTEDGYVDFHSLVAAMPGVVQRRAQRRLEAALAHRIALGGDAVRGLIERTEREARGEVSRG